ncbi:MAG TPA: Hpt domain-containing protein [Gemmatimonadaceae bacterium]|nr:Hpt domain-containing protein [Gemmatimonadaceae bacterium]
MTGPAPLLDFFVLEAVEYLEQLDAILSRTPAGSVPDTAAVQRLARALRGSATMAKLSAFAEVAAGIERMGRGLQNGTVQWTPGVGASLIGAVDDLKILVRSARTWSAADTERAGARVAELARYAPLPVSSTAPTPVVTGGLTFFATETMNIAAGVELLATRPDDRDAAGQVLKRLRALRGVAGIKDVPGLVDVLDATEDAAMGLERGTGPVSPRGEAVLRAAASVLRRCSNELRDGAAADSRASERLAFAEAVERWFEHEEHDETVVPIEELFYADQGPHIVSAALHPPTSSGERFRLELVSSGENLRGLVEAADATHGEATPRTRREFRRAIRGVAAVARSFGDRTSAGFFDDVAAGLATAKPLDLTELAHIAAALTNPGPHGELLFAKLAGERSADVERPPEAAVADVPLPPAPVSRSSFKTPLMVEQVDGEPQASTPPRDGRPSVRASSDEASTAATRDLLDAGVSAIGRLAGRSLATPASIPQAEIVSIESLLYRGRGALVRAIELRDELRRSGSLGAPPETLDELFDLLDLALAD